MNYIDRNNYPAARLSGLQEDLNMSDQQYQTGLSILFVGYVLMQVRDEEQKRKWGVASS